MYSWLFRNRERLRAIYGTSAGNGLPEEPDPAAPEAAPGGVVRRSRYVVLLPMPPAHGRRHGA